MIALKKIYNHAIEHFQTKTKIHINNSFEKQISLKHNVNYLISNAQKNLTKVFLLIAKCSSLSTNQNRSKLSPNNKQHVWLYIFSCLFLIQFLKRKKKCFSYVLILHISLVSKKPHKNQKIILSRKLFIFCLEFTLIMNKRTVKKKDQHIDTCATKIILAIIHMYYHM